MDQTGAAKQGANHARRQTVLRTAADCQGSPSRSSCPGGRRDSPLPRSLNTKSKDIPVYANVQIRLENWRIRVNRGGSRNLMRILRVARRIRNSTESTAAREREKRETRSRYINEKLFRGQLPSIT